MNAYRTLRTVHLISAALSLPMLLMYGISAVQMAHNSWFVMRPSVTETAVPVSKEYTNGRLLARDVMTARRIAGEISSVQSTPGGFNVRVTVPGTVHEIRYQRGNPSVQLRTSVAGFMGVLNRLHHAAGVSHDYVPLRFWGILAFIVAGATVTLGSTGIWMWWLRKQERRWGVLLVAANLAFSVTLLTLMRLQGP